MVRYIIKRLLFMIVTMLGVIVIVFSINYFTDGSPALAILGPAATPENIAQVEHEWGLDRPYFVQLGEYIVNLITKFDFGTSYLWKRPVRTMIAERLAITLKIGLLGAALTVVLGVPLGVVAAVRQNSVFDYIATVIAVILAAIPSFWLALLLIMLFSVNLGWLPISGLGTWKNLVLPIAVVGALPLATITRMTRSSMLEVLRQDYIRTARAKGLSERIVTYKHALRNGVIPVATAVGIMAGLAMTGTIIIETIFNIPGLGLLMNDAINQNDYILTQGIVLVCAFIICSMNLITDIVCAFLDPRIKAMYRGQSKQSKALARIARKKAKEGATS